MTNKSINLKYGTEPNVRLSNFVSPTGETPLAKKIDTYAKFCSNVYTQQLYRQVLPLHVLAMGILSVRLPRPVTDSRPGETDSGSSLAAYHNKHCRRFFPLVPTNIDELKRP